jgi:carbamoyl-phosphate synthase large subunit
VGKSGRNTLTPAINVLFTSAGRRVELVRAFRRAFEGLGLEGTIVGVDVDPLAPALQECDATFIVPRVDDANYVPSLIDVCARERIALLFPLIDPEIPVLARRRDEFDAAGTRAMVLPAESALIAADKLATAELFERLGVPAPSTWTGEDARGAELPFPVFVKPRFGSAGTHAHGVADREELEFWLRRVPEPVVQERLPGPEITSDVLCLEDGETAAVVSRRRIEVRTGEVAKGVTVHDPRVVQHCATIAEALRARGPITVQCLMRDSDPCFTEVNARFGGGVPLGIAAGVDSPRWLLAQAAGIDIELPPLGSYEVDLYMTRYDESFFVREEEHAALAGRRL